MKNQLIEEKMKPYFLLSPVLIIIVSILGFGIVNCVLQSLGYFPVAGLREITFKYYREVFTSADFIQSLNFSVYTSMVSSILSVVMGISIAYFILISNKGNSVLNKIYRIPIIVPHTVVVLLVFNVLSQSGVISRVFYYMGIIKNTSQFPLFILDRKGLGIITAYVWKEVPFIALVVYGTMSRVNKKLFEAALNLGASKKRAFFYVVLPLIMPSVVSCFLIVFAFSFGSFEVPYLIGPTFPKALPVKAYIEYSNSDLTNRPYAMVINTILIIITSILVFLYERCFSLFWGKQDRKYDRK